jgi:hypothetical protein
LDALDEDVFYLLLLLLLNPLALDVLTIRRRLFYLKSDY